ncbi:glycosylphosphatidylinositol anchor biosynthesis [Podila minutissima]|nr:glycosylphosphatidylinositol anchor biosynthesis [Podila minutissima]
MPAKVTSRWSETSILICLVVYRAINACLVKTYFSPDEYWQALEVGHKITFGYGYLTWEWDVGLRSVLHPAFFAALYKVLDLLGLDDGSVFIYAPRVLQAVFAALGDLYAYRFALRLFENQLVANWTLFLSVASWWNFFCSTRTLANSTEASLTIMALYYWPFNTPSGEHTRSFGDKVLGTSPNKQGSLTLSLAIASLTCIFRPTAAILWLFLGVALVLGYIRDGKLASVVSTLISAVLIGGVAILGSAILDSTLLYGHWIMTPLNFLRVNVLEGISLFYGSSPWHWYLSQGIPILFGIYIPLVLYGIWRSCKATTSLNQGLKSQVLGVCLWVLVVYSSLQHKEWRFLYPILYPLLPFGADTLYAWFLSPKGWQKSRTAWAVVLVLVVVNGVMAWYTALVHQRGVVDVMDWLREEMRAERVRSVGMLMPCHSTPWYSSVHLKDVEPVDMWFLTCEPPLGNIDASKYEDESDIFYKNPEAFMISRSSKVPESRNSKSTYGDASHLLLFDVLVPTLKPWLTSNGYNECARFFNSHFHDDSRRRGDVVVYCKV